MGIQGFGLMIATMLPPADAALFTRQTQEISACLDTYIPADRPVALLQFPYDGNVGMHMLWLATTSYLERRGIRIAYVAHEGNFSVARMMEAVGDGTILFIGGVTVSRLWPGHARIKRTVAAACPDNRLISLPSTMMFVDDDDRREASTIFGDHRDVILMARDPVSAASVREVFPAHINVVTIHDCAFMLEFQPRATRPDAHDVIWLARDDKEGAGFKVPEDVKVFDWPHLLNLTSPVVLAGRAASRLRRDVPVFRSFSNSVVTNSYKAISRSVLAGGNRILDGGKVLVTDRLHPHVLAALRGQHSVLLPDLFGKNRSVWEYSSHDYTTVHWADTAEQALEIARDLAS